MKLGKEEIQKIFLSLLLLVGLLYFYFNVLLGPLDAEQSKAQAGIDTLKPQIAKATGFIKDVKDLEAKAPAAQATIAQLKAMIPDGAPIAWYPPNMEAFLKQQGVQKCNVRIEGDAPSDGRLVGFKTLASNVEIPQVEVTQLGTVIAALENEKPLATITNIHIESSKELVQYQTARLSLQTIIKQ